MNYIYELIRLTMHSCLFGTLLNSFQHDADFSNQQYRKKYQKYKESSLDRTSFQSGYGRIYRKQILNCPRLATDFGHNPSRLTGKISQRNACQSNIMQPIYFRQLPFPRKKQYQRKKAMKYIPSPTITRKAQNESQTLGTRSLGSSIYP